MGTCGWCKRMNSARRLANGFAIIALGFVAALPFRQTPSMRVDRDMLSVAGSIPLGEELALQVPGQARITELDNLPTNPLEADVELPAESASDGKQGVAVDDQRLETLADPPAMADQYQPLFQPEKSGPPKCGHVVAPDSELPENPHTRRHTIHDGDTLESLAIRYLGDASRATDIFQANAQVLDDPEVLPIGVEITIPQGNRAVPAVGAQAAAARAELRLVPLPANLLRNGR